MLKHVKRALDSEETIRLLLLAKTIEKDGKIVMVIELLNVDLPQDPISNSTMFNRDGQITALIEAPEFRVGRIFTSLVSPSHRLCRFSQLSLWKSQRSARTAGCVLVRRVPGTLVVGGTRRLRRVDELSDCIVVVRVVLRIRFLNRCQSQISPFPLQAYLKGWAGFP